MSKLTQNITNAPRSIKGLKPLAYWAFRSDIQLTIIDNKVTAVVAGILGVIEGCKFFMNAGGEQVIAEDNFNGFKQKLNIIANKGSESIDGMDDVVFFVETMDGIKYVLGAKYGMWKTAQSAMSNDNLGAIALEFTSREGMEETAGDYYLVADISTIPTTTDYEAIEGLTIGNGSVTPQRIYLEVNHEKVCYVVQPNGVILTSMDGIINVNYNGTGGNVLLVVPKNSLINTINSGLAGILNTNITETINVPFCSKITSVNAPNSRALDSNTCTVLTNIYFPKAVVISAPICALTAQSLGDFLLDAIANNRTYAGTLIATGGTNAGVSAINTYLISMGTTLAAVLTQLATWTITLNP